MWLRFALYLKFTVSFLTLEWPQWNWLKHRIGWSCAWDALPNLIVVLECNTNTTNQYLSACLCCRTSTLLWKMLLCFKNVVFVAFCSRASKFGLKVGHPYPPSSKQRMTRGVISGQISSFNPSREERQEEDTCLPVRFDKFAKQMLGLG